MSKHHSGPWHAELLPGGAFEIQKDGAGFEGGMLVIATRREHPGMPEELHADARLIASAPDLLDALEELLAVAPHKPPGAGLIEGIEFRHAEALKRARAAIAKAKGEA